MFVCRQNISAQAKVLLQIINTLQITEIKNLTFRPTECNKFDISEFINDDIQHRKSIKNK